MNHSNGKNRSRSISRDREKQKQVQQPQKMIQQKQQIPSLFSSKMDEEKFIKNMGKSGIKYLDEHQETRRNGDYLFYCVNCECKLRNNWHLQDHIRTGEHLAKTNRVNDRAFLRDTFAKLKDKIECPTTDHIQALDILSATIQNNSDFMHDEFIQKRDIQQILVALEKTLQNEFGSNIDKGEQAVKLEITGSFLTELHVAKENNCDLNIFAQFHEGLEKSQNASFLFNGCFEAIKKICRHLPKSNPLSPARKIVHYGAPIIRIQLFFDQFSYFLNLGIGKQAEKAHYSTRFVLAYLHIWPPLRRLIRFVRYWAQINYLTFQSCAGITNYAFDILCIFYLQRIGYLPILNEFIKEILTNEEFSKIQIPVKNVVELCQLPEEQFFDACRTFRHLYYGQRIPNLSDGKMIQGFFKYFATEFDLHNKCDITSHELTNKPYCEKHFIVIDPFIECNILRLRLEGEAYFWNCIIKTATYLCIPQTPKGPLINILFNKSEFDMKKIKISFLRIKTNTFEWNQGAMRMIQSGECPIEYNFNMLNFQSGEIPQIICQHCNLRGHCDWDCHLVRPCSSYGLIPPIRANLRNNLTNAIMEIYKDGILTKKRAAKIANYINELKKILSETFGVDDLSLTPFGSVVNGFGMNDCDLDLCLQSAKINQQIQTQEIIEKMDKKLRSLGYKTQTIFLAKVPIIKFQEPKNDFRGDISIGNCLGLKNSDLLKTYTEFDHRVAPLGLFIKRLFKLHNLNDSPNGSFSSYSIIIMLIAYLQRGCDPPVLPFLQELTKDENPREMLEGWDVTFEHHPTNKCLPDAKMNKQTLAELFIGFLHYFLGKFDPKMNVVQIRQSAPLFKMDKTNGNKRWDQYTFCVEDPFDLNHNLCGGIKQDVLLQFFTLLRSVLNELAILDKKQEKNVQQWANENGTQQQETSTLSELLKNMGPENNNKLSVMPKLFGFL